jgi:hypothetical protein
MTTQTLLGLILILVQSAVTALLTTGLLQRWLEHYKSELSLALGRTSRFDEKELAALEEAWTKTGDAVACVGEVLRKDGGSEQDRSGAVCALLALHDFLLDGDIYLPVSLSARFLELHDALEATVLGLALSLHCRDEMLQQQGFEVYRDSVLPTYQLLKEEMRYYLRHHREPEGRLEPSRFGLNRPYFRCT